MSYQDSAALGNDALFRERTQAALWTESRSKPDDPLAVGVMQAGGVQWFMPYLSTAPGFDVTYADGGQAAITDGDLLAAIQANWDAVAATANLPADPTP